MNLSRRRFLQTSLVSVATAAFVSRFASLAARAADAAGLPLAKESDAAPKALKFCVNADKPSASCPTRKEKERKNQYCYNCQLFTRTGGEGKKGAGKCMVLPTNSVNANSWCMSWVQNPSVKG